MEQELTLNQIIDNLIKSLGLSALSEYYNRGEMLKLKYENDKLLDDYVNSYINKILINNE